MEKEFNLSEKIYKEMNWSSGTFSLEDVKEFIKRLKEVLTPQLFHDIYEKQARKSGWETHKDCKLKPFDELPETNQETMIYTLNEIHKEIDKLAEDDLK